MFSQGPYAILYIMEANDKFNKIVEKLKEPSDLSEKEKQLDDLLNLVTDAGDNDKISSEQPFSELIKEFSQLMITKDGPHQKIANIIAELAKTESLRQPFVDGNVIPTLVKMLRSSDNSDVIQACRALGNICYENDEARNCVDENDGLQTLLNLMKGIDSNNGSDVTKLRTVACGLLLNVTNTHELLQKKALEGGALDILEDYLKNHSEEEGLPYMVLLALDSLAETDFGRQKMVTCGTYETVLDFMHSSKVNSAQDTTLDLLCSLAENDEIKVKLAQSFLCDHLIQTIQSNSDELAESNQQLLKLSSDLIVLLLTGDKSMEILFENGKGTVYKESIRWLESSCEYLQISGALAIGNFARNDGHCILLEDEGVVTKMLNLLKTQDHREPNIPLLHAILSALRNLAIPVSNKSKLYKAGAIEVLLNFASTPILPVTFKLLGALRMLIDGQDETAKVLGRDKEFISRLVEWCGVEEHAGVKGEATRLLAWIIKNSKNAEVMKNIVRADGVQYLVTMATSEHYLMQNEALIALTLIVGSSVLDEAAMALKEAELIEVIANLLKSQQTLPNIIANTLSLTRALVMAVSHRPPQLAQCTLLACTGMLSNMQSNLREELMCAGIPDLAKQLSSHENEDVRNAAEMLINVLEEGPSVER